MCKTSRGCCTGGLQTSSDSRVFSVGLSPEEDAMNFYTGGTEEVLVLESASRLQAISKGLLVWYQQERMKLLNS